jgi:hypothetical protein
VNGRKNGGRKGRRKEEGNREKGLGVRNMRETENGDGKVRMKG